MSWEHVLDQFLKWAGVGALGLSIAAVARAAFGARPLPGPGPSPTTPPEKYPYDPTKDEAGPFLQGVDVSVAQGTMIDWGAAKSDAGLVFAIAKATQGAPGYPRGFVDGAFTENRKHMPEILPFWGAYHYAIVSQPARLQAQALAKQILIAPPSYIDKMLPPSVDLEWVYNDGKTPASSPFPKIGGQQTVDWLGEWHDETVHRLGRRSMIYTAIGFWHFIGNPKSSILASYALWAADWTPPLDYPHEFAYPAIHQYSAEQGPLAGIPIKGIPGKSVDRDRFRGTLDDMAAFIAASKV